jgi:PAS domain S-box-containing protein
MEQDDLLQSALLIVERSNNPIVILDDDLTITYLNKIGNDQFGHLISNHPNIYNLFEQYLEDEREDILHSIESDVTLIDGSELFFKIDSKKYIFKTYVFDIEGNYAIIFNDITEESFLNKRLKKQIQLVEDNVLISKTNSKGIITYASQKFCDLAGYTKSELIGQPHNIVRHPDMPKEAFEDLWNTVQSGQIWTGEVKNRKKDGGFYWVKANVSPDFNYNGDLIGYTSVRSDITLEKMFNDKLYHDVEEKSNELAKQETLLQQKSKNAIMGEMISLITHQWKQPLSAMSLKISDIKIKYALGMIDEQYINDISKSLMRSINYMSETIDDFKNFFKPNRENEKIKPSEVVKDSLKLLEPIIKKESIDVKADFGNSCEITTRKNELLQVVMNIIKNGIDILIEKEIKPAKIDIKLFETDQTSTIYIGDNGGGVPTDLIEKVFEPYFSTKGDKGTGLGLYMSKNIIENQLGGKLRVENINGGATFIIELPKV